MTKFDKTLNGKRPRHLVKVPGMVTGDMLSLNDRGDVSAIGNPGAVRVVPEIIGSTFSGDNLVFTGILTTPVHASIVKGKFQLPDNFDPSGDFVITIAGMPNEAAGAGHRIEVWTADTVIALNEVRKPTTDVVGLYFQCTSRSGDFKTAPVLEPTWAGMVAGDTVVDDKVVWTAVDRTNINFDLTFGVVNDGDLIKGTDVAVSNTDDGIPAPTVAPATTNFPFSVITVSGPASLIVAKGAVAGSYVHFNVARSAGSAPANTSDFFLTDISIDIPVR